MPANASRDIPLPLTVMRNGLPLRSDLAVTGGLAPNQRPMIAKLGLRALLAGSLANLMSAALAGLMIG